MFTNNHYLQMCESTWIDYHSTEDSHPDHRQLLVKDRLFIHEHHQPLSSLIEELRFRILYNSLIYVTARKGHCEGVFKVSFCILRHLEGTSSKA